jgi:hypothetical protein
MLLFHVVLVAASAAPASPAAAPSFEQGSWWARLPIKNSLAAPDNDGSLNATLAAIRSTKMTLVGFDAEVCGAAATPGDTGTGGVGIGDLVAFLDAAAAQMPELKVFASLSSHHPLADYCHLYLNDQKTDVNWTRVGAVIANATRGRHNFVGVYIDDFYVMMCTPESSTFSRHGPSLPCVPLSAMDNMRAAMQAITPSLDLMPLVYHLQAAFIVPNSYVIGAPGHVAFVPPAKAAVSMTLPPPARTTDKKSVTLRFFYHCWLSVWTKPGMLPVNGTVIFQATVNGHVVLSVDASTVHETSFFEAEISQWLADDDDVDSSAPVALSFETFPTAAAASPEHHWMKKDCWKTSYVFGVSLDTSHPAPNPDAVQFSKSGGAELLAREPTESTMIGHAEGMIFQRQQDPSRMLSMRGYATHITADGLDC